MIDFINVGMKGEILGASTSNIVWSLSSRFTLLVLAASILAVPMSWYLMEQWLANFAYWIVLTPWLFLLAAVMAWLTVSYQSILAALSNLVEALRSD